MSHPDTWKLHRVRLTGSPLPPEVALGVDPMVLIPRFTSMKSSHSIAALLARVHLLLRWMPSLLLLLPPVTGSASAEGVAQVLDDYSDPKRNRCGVERLLIDDRTAGSKSKATLSCEKGILRVQGDLVPGRGVPAFISQVSLLAPEGKARDLSGYQGIRLRVKVIKGILCVQVGSTEITNFDYHTGAPIAGGRGEFQEVRIPFKDMKRAWSEPTALNLGSITSVNLVSFGMARDAFAYEVDELGFY